MACCCHVSAEAMAVLSASATLAASAQLSGPVPEMPPNLKAVLALTTAHAPSRADQALLPHLPKLSMLVTTAIKLNPILLQVSALLALGPFDFSDMVKLSAQLDVMAASLNGYITPHLKATLKMDLTALFKIAAMANAVLTLKQAGLDPFSADFNSAVSLLASRPVLPVLPLPPTLPDLQIIAALPDILTMCDRLKVPLSDPSAAAMINAKLSAIATLVPPRLSLKIPALLTLAATASAVAAITEAFGGGGSLAAGQAAMFGRISLAMKAVAALPPLPVIDLGNLEGLPGVDKVILGAQIAEKGFLPRKILALRPPNLKAAAFLSASIAIQAALSDATNTPPLSFCTKCIM